MAGHGLPELIPESLPSVATNPEFERFDSIIEPMENRVLLGDPSFESAHCIDTIIMSNHGITPETLPDPEHTVQRIHGIQSYMKHATALAWAFTKLGFIHEDDSVTYDSIYHTILNFLGNTRVGFYNVSEDWNGYSCMPTGIWGQEYEIPFRSILRGFGIIMEDDSFMGAQFSLYDEDNAQVCAVTAAEPLSKGTNEIPIPVEFQTELARGRYKVMCNVSGKSSVRVCTAPIQNLEALKSEVSGLASTPRIFLDTEKFPDKLPAADVSSLEGQPYALYILVDVPHIVTPCITGSPDLTPDEDDLFLPRLTTNKDSPVKFTIPTEFTPKAKEVIADMSALTPMTCSPYSRSSRSSNDDDRNSTSV